MSARFGAVLVFLSAAFLPPLRLPYASQLPGPISAAEQWPLRGSSSDCSLCRPTSPGPDPTSRFAKPGSWWRAVTNAAAVLLVFSALRYTTVTNANMLNMSYPVFVFLLAPWVNRERTQRSHYLYLVLAMTGTVLTFALILPGFVMPAGHELLYTMLAALFSLFGQICLTAGYRSVRSGAGSVISAARIVIAAGIGIAFLGEPPSE